MVKGLGEKAPAPEEETIDTSELGGGLLSVELLQATTTSDEKARSATRMGTSEGRKLPAEL
jgi:hypothetical protein